MKMEKASDDALKTGNTLLFAVLLLFFIQLVGMWTESIYRMSLVKLAPGKELCGVVLLLLPLVGFIVSEKRERRFLWAAAVTFVAARLLCPQLGAVGQIIVGGLGVSMFLIILACAFSARYSRLKGDMGQAVGIAVLLSVTFRTWGSSADISTEGVAAVVGWLLAAAVLYQLRAALSESTVAPPTATLSSPPCTVAMLGLFANLTLVYLVFSCPAVVCAWSGYAALEFSGVAAAGCVAVAFMVVLLMAQRMASTGWFLVGGWNVLLIGLLVGGLFLGRTMFPVSAESPAVVVSGDGGPFGGVLPYMALLLAPVLVFNVRRIASLPPCARPRNALLPVMAGMGLLFALTLMLIFSNVWGYVPFGPLLRNRFYLPFLIAGVGMLLPWLLRHREASACAPARGRLLGGVAILLAVLAVAGACVHVPRRKPSVPKKDLTILTYNMQQGSHINANRNYNRQLDLLRRLHPDIIGLQESDTARPSGGNVDAVRHFAESLGYYAYYGPGSIAGTFGAAILSRYPIKNARSFFTYSDSDEVGTAVGEIDVGGTTIAFFSNHPSGGDKVMNAHVNALKAEAGRYAHVISVGDYNFNAREPYFASLSQVLQDSASLLGEAQVNKHGGKGSLADEIDHIFVSSNIRVLESHYLPPPDSETDHPAHWSVVRIE